MADSTVKYLNKLTWLRAETKKKNFFTETAVTPERRVEKWFPKWEINRHAEG